MPLVLLIVVFCAYSILLAVYIARGTIWRVPFFSIYLLLFLIRLPFWIYAVNHQSGLGILPYFEPALIGSKLFMFTEAFSLATETLSVREQRCILGLVGCCAVMAVLLALGTHTGFYLAIRSYSNLALAMASLVGVGCFWLAPVRICTRLQAHCAILAVYFTNLAACGLLPAKSVQAWKAINTSYFAGSLICCGLWMAYGLSRRKVRTTSSTSLRR